MNIPVDINTLCRFYALVKYLSLCLDFQPYSDDTEALVDLNTDTKEKYRYDLIKFPAVLHILFRLILKAAKRGQAVINFLLLKAGDKEPYDDMYYERKQRDNSLLRLFERYLNS